MSPYLPGPNPADVDVDEIGFRVISDPAGIETKGRLAQVGQAAAGKPDVHRLPDEVKTIRRHPAASAPEPGVRFWRAVPRDHVKRLTVADPYGQAMEKVEEADVDLPDGSRDVIPKDMIDLGQRLRAVVSGFPIARRKPFPRMGMKERQVAFQAQNVQDGPRRGPESGRQEGGRAGKEKAAAA
jgi:hypothetical protein